jgi:hypothetical protein
VTQAGQTADAAAGRLRVLDLELDPVADAKSMAPALLFDLHRGGLDPEPLGDLDRECRRPAELARAEGLERLALLGVARSSRKKPRRQLSIRGGASPTNARFSPPTSVPSISPLSIRIAKVNSQRSPSAGSAKPAIHGQIRSQLHLSKYVPSILQATGGAYDPLT